MLKVKKINQKGLASIFISMIMMIVIALIVLGFAQYADKEASQVLNRQLSTAAFYVAESGVNEVASVFKNDGFNLPEKNTCTNSSDPQSYIQQVGDNPNVSIPCLLVYADTNHLRNNLPLGSSWITPVNGANSIDYLNISWQNPNINTSLPHINDCFGVASSSDLSNINQSPPYNLGPTMSMTNRRVPYGYGQSCDAGIIKVDLVSANNLNQSYTYYFYPQPVGKYGGSTNPTNTIITPYSDNTEGIPLPGSCPGSNSLSSEYCNVTIDLSGLKASAYYLRIKTFYLPADIEISALSSSPPTTTPTTTIPSFISLTGDQIVADVTGKVNDVLQRIRVNMSPNTTGTNGSGVVPNSALSITQSICKQFYYNGQSVIQNNLGESGCQNNF